MKTIGIKEGGSETEYNCPENWGEVKLTQFQEIMAYNDKFKDRAEISDEENTDRITFIMSVLLDTDDLTINKLDVIQWTELSQQIEWVVTTEPTTKLPAIIKIGEQEFMLEPNMNMMSKGNWIDANNFVKKGIADMHQLIACFIREVKVKKPKYPTWYLKAKKIEQEYELEIQEYDSEGRNLRAEMFQKEMTMDQAYPIFVFFWIFASEFLQTSSHYLSQMMTMEQVDK